MLPNYTLDHDYAGLPFIKTGVLYSPLFGLATNWEWKWPLTASLIDYDTDAVDIVVYPLT